MLIYLPSGEHGEKVGVDDFLAAGHTVDDLLELASSEIRKASRDDDVPGVDEAGSQADVLVAIGQTGELFHDPLGDAFASIAVDGHRETWRVSSKRFKSWLRRAFYQMTGKAVGNEALTTACGLLEGIAAFDGPTETVHVRVARNADTVSYDLADHAWRTVAITPGAWSVLDESPVRFRRYTHQAAQVEPTRGGSVRLVLKYLNVRAEDHLLLLVWLVVAFVADIPHPIPDFHGEKGAGKSVGQRVLRRLIDPSIVESLSFPKDIAELVQQLAHHYAPIYDNVDEVPPWLSDVLCRAVTGEGFTKRELYTDDDDIIYAYRRVPLLNGINVVPRRADLLDRSILLQLERITRGARLAEDEFWAAFEADRPFILGGIFDTLATALQILPDVRLDQLERMADFTRFGVAVALALGFTVDEFLDAYASNLGVQTIEAVEGHLVGAAILALMADRDEWQGTPTEFLYALEEAGEAAHLFRRSSTGKVDARGWPGAPHILTRRVNEVRSNLRDVGLEVEQTHKDDRTIIVSRVRPTGEGSVGSVGSVDDDFQADAANATDAIDATDAEIPVHEGVAWEMRV